MQLGRRSRVAADASAATTAASTAFERMSVGLGAIRALKHERYLDESRGGLADVVPIDTDRYAAPEQLRRESW
jgi:hypothetical protein